MKTQRLVYSPTRSRRLNEMLGLIVLVGAGLLLLALASYTPSDPSLNTVGGGAQPGLPHGGVQNWAGLAGAYTSDLLLQTLGIAIFFVPLALIRIGLAWMRSLAAGSTPLKLAGLALWLIFAPALIALLPGHLLWRGALPICGVEGAILAGALTRFANLPGALALCGLMVALSLYLTTSFLVATAGAWFSSHFGFVRSLTNRFTQWRSRRRQAAQQEFDPDSLPRFDSRQSLAAIRAAKQQESEQRRLAREAEPNSSLLSSFFGWFSRRKRTAEEQHPADLSSEPETTQETPSVWNSIPRTMVDEAPATGLQVAAAAAALGDIDA